MKYDHELIFEAYMQTISEADMPWSQHGIKAAAGAHKRGVSVVSPEEEARHKDIRFYRNISSDIEHGKIIDILDLLSDHFRGRDKARRTLMRFLKTNDVKQKSAYNPFPEMSTPEYPDMTFKVPNFRLPDLLSAIKSEMKAPSTREIDSDSDVVPPPALTPTERDLLETLFNKLASIYKENYGGDATDDTELNAVRSFIAKLIRRSFRGGERQVLQQVVFGGKSQRDEFEHVFITNTRELQGANWDRIKKIAHLLFTGEERFNPDERASDTHVPERETPENLAGETLADPDREAHQQRLRQQEKQTEPPKPKKKPTTEKKPTPKKKPAEKKSTTPEKKPTTEKKSTTPKKKSKKQEDVKESYQFFKVIPF